MSEVYLPPVEAFIPKPDSLPPFLNYKVGGQYITDIYDWAMEEQQPILLEGLHGEGKTLSVFYYCAKKQIPLVVIQCGDISFKELISVPILKEKSVEIVYGLFTLAFLYAKQHGRACLLLEELNALPPTTQKELNASTDFKRMVIVPETREVIRLPQESKLLIVGTQNPRTRGYLGVYTLNMDLRSRFLIFNVYPRTDEEVKKILEMNKISPQTPEDETILNALLKIKEATRKKMESSYYVSTRDIVNLMKLWHKFKSKHLLRHVITAKFDPEERPAIKELCESVGL